MNEISQLKSIINNNIKPQSKENQSNNIFEEIKIQNFEGNKNEP